MKADVCFIPTSPVDEQEQWPVCVVLDIFRATSSIVTAMYNGCTKILPVLSSEAAWGEMDRHPGCLLAGERHSIRIEGFDLGNSPQQFSAANVAARTIIMSTTNGTRAICAAQKAEQVWIGAFINARAVADKIMSVGKDVQLLCAGTEGEFSLEDALCAGLLITRLRQADKGIILSDAAQAAALLYTQAEGHLYHIAAASRNGQRLVSLALEQDVAYCLTSDVLELVPRYDGQYIREN